jgi:hypothetical protein
MQRPNRVAGADQGGRPTGGKPQLAGHADGRRRQAELRRRSDGFDPARPEAGCAAFELERLGERQLKCGCAAPLPELRPAAGSEW